MRASESGSTLGCQSLSAQGVGFENNARIIKVLLLLFRTTGFVVLDRTNEDRMSEKSTSEELERQVRGQDRRACGIDGIEKNIANTSELLSLVIKHSPVFAYLKEVTHSESKFICASDNFVDIFGIPASQLIGKAMDELFPNELARKITHDDIDAISTGNRLDIEEEFNGRNYLTYKFPIKQGDRNYLAGYLIDLAERKEMELELISRDREYRTLVESFPDFIVRYDLDLMRTYVNPAWEKASGLSAEEVINVPHADIPRVPVPAVDEYIKKIRQVMRTGGSQALEFTWVNADGVKLFLDYIIVPEYDRHGNIAGALSVGRDITGRKQAEAALRESEAKYRSMMEAFADPLYICSPDFTVEYMNPAMIRRTGRDATGERCHHAVHGLDRRCQWCAFDRVSQGEKVEMNVKSPFDQKNYRITHMPIRNQDGTISKMTIFRDITDYMQAVSEKEKAQTQLMQAQKMDSIGNLAGGIAHDFNNLLSSIIGFTELAMDEAPKGTTLEDSLREVYSAGRRAKDLVKQILAFARQSEEKKNPIQPGMIVKEVLKLIRSAIPATIEIRQKIASDSLIMGNATQIHQVLMNLCTNAAHAMEDSGGVLEVSLKDVVVGKGDSLNKIGMHRGDYVEITVSDTGVGIAPEIIGSIFDPYFTTKNSGEGTGMGLALVHGIIESCGGKVFVDSRLGEGTEFKIYLPVTAKHAAPGLRAREHLPSGTERILFVDDELTIAKMGGKILERLGYSVTTRTSSIEALELFRAKPGAFDLVITDMTMPNLSGDRLATELMKIRPDIPIILCTGYSKKISDETAFDIGFKAFAYKPMVRADLAKTVRKVLDNAD
jgi:PAS domain S-box-containing protein